MKTGLYKKSLDFCGSMVDEIFLLPGNLFCFFKKPREISQELYSAQLEYYYENGFVEDPERFFHLPESLPQYDVISEKPYDEDGKIQIISFHSEYEVKNPLIRERFTSFENNHTAYLVRWTHGGPGRKTLLCLHGYMLGDPEQAHRMFRVQKMYRTGLDVALFITPFHWKRKPSIMSQRGIFLQPDDVVMTLECVGQTMHDLHRTIKILENEGASQVGLVGASLGGYHAGLYACLSGNIHFAALIVPAVRFSRPLSPEVVRLPFKPGRDLMEKVNTLWTMHSPINFFPKISREKLMVIASRGDRLCPFQHVEKLCGKWGLTRYRFMTGGHWLVFNNHARGKTWYGFLNDMGFSGD